APSAAVGQAGAHPGARSRAARARAGRRTRADTTMVPSNQGATRAPAPRARQRSPQLPGQMTITDPTVTPQRAGPARWVPRALVGARVAGAGTPARRAVPGS